MTMEIQHDFSVFNCPSCNYTITTIVHAHSSKTCICSCCKKEVAVPLIFFPVPVKDTCEKFIEDFLLWCERAGSTEEQFVLIERASKLMEGKR